MAFLCADIRSHRARRRIIRTAHSKSKSRYSKRWDWTWADISTGHSISQLHRLPSKCLRLSLHFRLWSGRTCTRLKRSLFRAASFISMAGLIRVGCIIRIPKRRKGTFKTQACWNSLPWRFQRFNTATCSKRRSTRRRSRFGVGKGLGGETRLDTGEKRSSVHHPKVLI